MTKETGYIGLKNKKEEKMSFLEIIMSDIGIIVGTMLIAIGVIGEIIAITNILNLGFFNIVLMVVGLIPTAFGVLIIKISMH